MTTKLLTLEEAFALGREHGAEMAHDSRSADPGVDGWDGMLINADVQFARQAFGFNGIDSSEEAKQLLRKYAEGCQAGADAAIAERGAVAGFEPAEEWEDVPFVEFASVDKYTRSSEGTQCDS